MQKIATRVFICSSIAFGIIGILMVITTDINSDPSPILFKLMFTSVIFILTSFALSIAGKYLDGKF